MLFNISLLVSALLATLVTSTVNAQQLPSYVERPADAAGVFAFWPGSGVPPGSEKWNWHEQMVQVPGKQDSNSDGQGRLIPTVTMYEPARGTANGTALIVAPGGAFNFLMMDTEGYEMAHWLTQLGVTAFVLKYRVAHTPQNDTEFFTFVQNLLTVLPHPGPTIDPNRIGIAGFSAGGVPRWKRRCATTPSAGRIPLLVSTPGYRIAAPLPSDALLCLLPPQMTTDSSRLFPEQDSTRPGIRPANRQSCTSSQEASTASGCPIRRHVDARNERSCFII